MCARPIVSESAERRRTGRTVASSSSSTYPPIGTTLSTVSPVSQWHLAAVPTLLPSHWQYSLLLQPTSQISLSIKQFCGLEKEANIYCDGRGMMWACQICFTLSKTFETQMDDVRGSDLHLHWIVNKICEGEKWERNVFCQMKSERWECQTYLVSSSLSWSYPWSPLPSIVQRTR